MKQVLNLKEINIRDSNLTSISSVTSNFIDVGTILMN